MILPARHTRDRSLGSTLELLLTQRSLLQELRSVARPLSRGIFPWQSSAVPRPRGEHVEPYLRPMALRLLCSCCVAPPTPLFILATTWRHVDSACPWVRRSKPSSLLALLIPHVLRGAAGSSVACSLAPGVSLPDLPLGPGLTTARSDLPSLTATSR